MVYILKILKKIHLYFMLLIYNFVLLKLFLLWVFLSLIMLWMFYFRILLKCKTFLMSYHVQFSNISITLRKFKAFSMAPEILV